MPLTPSERSLRARLAAHTLHSRVNPTQHTEAARRAFRERFEREVDPEGVLSPSERARRAEHALKAHMARLALKSAQARRKAKRAAS